MAAFDAKRHCYIGRVVFDGAALAGKTTTLTRITEIVPSERRTEMITPGALKGRTMFFDWLEIDGPVSSSSAGIKFQLITVPGQVERNHRRRPLIAMADAVVFVFDSSPEGVDRSHDAWQRLRRVMRNRKRPIPLLVQANKQDTHGAATADEIAEQLGVSPEYVIPASSADGLGVQRTIASALKLAHSAIKQAVEHSTLEFVGEDDEDADALFFSMLEHDARAMEEPESDGPGTDF